jgi:hypothetical protein
VACWSKNRQGWPWAESHHGWKITTGLLNTMAKARGHKGSTYELWSEPTSLWEDSCLTVGVTMAGWGMPVVCRVWCGGTMWGGNLEDRKLCKSSESKWMNEEGCAHIIKKNTKPCNIHVKATQGIWNLSALISDKLNTMILRMSLKPIFPFIIVTDIRHYDFF